jgi:phage tail-like protein
MSDREHPYGAFNFLVEIVDGPNEAAFGKKGGFSDVSGLSTDITIAEYREGNAGVNHVLKVPGIHKVGDVTLKRGVIDSGALWQWIVDTREIGWKARQTVTITLLDEARKPIDPPQKWTLQGCVPMKYTGPTLAAKGGGDVAIEELVLSVEELIFDTPSA